LVPPSSRPPPAPPHHYTLPYTTLFRSPAEPVKQKKKLSYHEQREWDTIEARIVEARSVSRPPSVCSRTRRWSATTSACSRSSPRSEEHTSELQSRENLVCRLLLEKKKN